MDFERATYSRSALTECADLIKSTNWTVGHKAEHFMKCFEIEKVYNFCFEKNKLYAL